MLKMDVMMKVVTFCHSHYFRERAAKWGLNWATVTAVSLTGLALILVCWTDKVRYVIPTTFRLGVLDAKVEHFGRVMDILAIIPCHFVTRLLIWILELRSNAQNASVAMFKTPLLLPSAQCAKCQHPGALHLRRWLVTSLNIFCSFLVLQNF